MKHKISALRSFYQRYRDAFRQVWHIRDRLDPPTRTADELAFLPAHLELVDTPLSPLPQWGARAIILLCTLALLWAILGHMDIVAVSGGKTLTGGRTKIIQALEPSVIESIHVKDGQHVDVGQLLIKLDATTAKAEFQKARESLIASQQAYARYSALLTAVETGKVPALAAVDGETPAQHYAEEIILQGQYHAFAAQVGTKEKSIAQKEAEINTIQQEINKLMGISEIIASKAADYKRLYNENFMSRHEWLQKEQEYIEHKSNLSIQRSRLVEYQAALKALQQELDSITAQFRSDALEKQKQAQDNAIQYEHETRKNKQRQDILSLTAPVSGMVQQLAVHTVRGIVTEAQPLLAIVPDDDIVEVEAMVENRDIGFVEVGQEAVVKIESFPYTRYGHIKGIVENVSHDAIQDEKKGLIFPARIRLAETYLMIDGKKIHLTSGMAVSVEIKTGKRRVIDYFLSPLKQYSTEGLRER
ncbi:HlyD family type I secretion membrane fusion protein [Serratia fonticola]|jgi:hemolysin D|uniref:Membrane fusion protein (MFP) family protein n=1 Tax=Serratia fonticola TaxID=47917 RepID=A0A542D445_SERFO|nr:HlyD family type I secretion periplasmic adaptor subunit [Serratia fonticola]TQI80115.1 HlyD family type I secretion membrane fusion protein [Serratia fonticola]TQI97858.1 hemolysin D [Serratia fonticola]TVZ72356.1 HlyD family type I secretion membrane fusion protein [Serratia fonticola]